MALQESEVLDQVQAMCILAHSGVETLGWWTAMQQRFDNLASWYCEQILSAGNSPENQEPRTGHATILP